MRLLDAGGGIRRSSVPGKMGLVSTSGISGSAERRRGDLKTLQAAAFGLSGVRRTGRVVAAIGRFNMVSTSADGTLHPAINKIEHQRRMHGNGRMQGRRQSSCTISNAGNRVRLVRRWVAGARGVRCRRRRSGIRRLLPIVFTWIRSSDESTLRTVRPETVSSASTFQGSRARRSSSSTPSAVIAPIFGKRNSR